MRSIIVIGLLGASAALAAPAPALSQDVIKAAGGTPPNAPLPPKLSENGIAGFQTAHFLENMEAAFFAEGLQNITAAGGWSMTGSAKLAQDTIASIAAQEQVHVATIEGVLKHFNSSTVPPCNYSFPVNNVEEFLALGDIITSVGIGAVNYLAMSLATSDPLLVTSTVSILSVESRHDAFFRLTDGEVPNPSPFDTQISGEWAYNLALPFAVPGSCAKNLSIPVLPALTVSSVNSSRPSGGRAFAPPHPPTELAFSWNADMVKGTAANKTQLYIAWVNQANVPFFTNLKGNGTGQGTAAVPPGMTGLAFAALTSKKGMDNIIDLTKATLAGPAVIPIS